ncbi:hypothetical protein BKA70DRAFT_1406166 [Coprinopsis sp. MPI-PUGE-AT-0042]|nr:hypothetical protein BKA70DRAFT_1406166 [Coprinopsis sp. MPI-PUGE-AT-0042]
MPILGNLVTFVKRLDALSSFTLAPVRPEEVTLSNHWWSRLSPASRSLFQHLAALPTLRALSLMGAYVPLSRYIHHPYLESLSIPVGITTQPSPTSFPSGKQQAYAPLRSLSITLLNQDRDKEFWHVSVGTLRGLLKNHTPLFRTLTHLNLSVNVNLGDMEDLRKALEETKLSLTHLTCSLGWDPGDRFFWMEVFSDPVSQQSAIQEYSKLDLGNMKALRSLQLEYDSPSSFDFQLTFPLILASLRTVPWNQLHQLWLILNIRCLVARQGPSHSSWTPHTYFHPLDELISSSLENKSEWTEVQLRINHDCDKCAMVVSGPTEDQSSEFLPLLHALSKKGRKVHLTCQYRRGPYTHTSNSDF